MNEPIRFRLGPNCRPLAGWRCEDPSVAPWTNAQDYALKHGSAGVWHTDGSFTLFFRVDGILQQRTWPVAIPYFDEPRSIT